MGCCPSKAEAPDRGAPSAVKAVSFVLPDPGSSGSEQHSSPAGKHGDLGALVLSVDDGVDLVHSDGESTATASAASSVTREDVCGIINTPPRPVRNPLDRKFDVSSPPSGKCSPPSSPVGNRHAPNSPGSLKGHSSYRFSLNGLSSSGWQSSSSGGRGRGRAPSASTSIRSPQSLGRGSSRFSLSGSSQPPQSPVTDKDEATAFRRQWSGKWYDCDEDFRAAVRADVKAKAAEKRRLVGASPLREKDRCASGDESDMWSPLVPSIPAEPAPCARLELMERYVKEEPKNDPV